MDQREIYGIIKCITMYMYVDIRIMLLNVATDTTCENSLATDIEAYDDADGMSCQQVTSQYPYVCNPESEIARPGGKCCRMCRDVCE